MSRKTGGSLNLAIGHSLLNLSDSWLCFSTYQFLLESLIKWDCQALSLTQFRKLRDGPKYFCRGSMRSVATGLVNTDLEKHWTFYPRTGGFQPCWWSLLCDLQPSSISQINMTVVQNVRADLHQRWLGARGRQEKQNSHVGQAAREQSKILGAGTPVRP